MGSSGNLSVTVLIGNRPKPLLASLALGIVAIHPHQRGGGVHVLAMRAGPGWRG